MQEAVSDILVERARDAEGLLSRMVLLSLFVHAVLLAALVVMPAGWRAARLPADVTPMMITLGGAPGPDAGGINPLAGRAVQIEAPRDVKPKTEPPPAPKAPEMVAPAAKPAPKTPAKIEKPADKSPSRRPTSGEEIKPGSQADIPGAAVPFGGLSTGGGGGTGLKLDVENFCCPAYLVQMTQLIKQNWNKNQGASGQVQVKFTIQRDGLLTDVQLEKTSGAVFLDLESQRALLKTRQLPALPKEFTERTLTVHLIFEYQR